MIGLLTPFHVANYGTKLQAYAVQKCIQGLGYKTEIIDFEYSHVRITPSNFTNKVICKLAARKYKDSNEKKLGPDAVEQLRKKRIDAINRFDWHYTVCDKVSGKEKMVELSKRYSHILCGSDQIWNPVNIGSEIFLLEWVSNETKRVSFAASFGISKLPLMLKKKYKKELSKFDAISVREDSARDMVLDLGLDAKWILDPTLIVDKNTWVELTTESICSIEGKYIFCYFLGEGTMSREVAKKIKALSQGMQIVSLSHFKGYNEADLNFADIDLYDVGVSDFINLIRNAEFICTDSFHATAFSVIFEKEFVVCNRHNSGANSTNSRLHSFMASIGIADRICNSLDSIEKCVINKIEYDKVNKRLENRRNQSITFLNEALKME